MAEHDPGDLVVPLTTGALADADCRRTTQGGRAEGERLVVTPQLPRPQPPARFVLNDLMRYWNPAWTLERAGFGGDGVGAMPGLRGLTHLDGDILATYPRDEARGLVLRRQVKLGATPVLSVEVAAEPKRAWELEVYVGNRRIHRQLVVGAETGREFQRLSFDLAAYAGRDTILRLYQRTLMPGAEKLPGNAVWRNLELK